MKENNSNEKNDIIEETKKQILKNSIVAIVIILCLIAIFITYSIVQDSMFSRPWQAITMILVIASIVFFEIAYKKDSGIIAINGIEILALSCFTLTIDYMKSRFNIDIKIYIIISTIIFLVYFLLKTMIIYTSGRKKELKSFSDIAEIVKEDTPKKIKAVKHKKENKND